MIILWSWEEILIIKNIFLWGGKYTGNFSHMIKCFTFFDDKVVWGENPSLDKKRNLSREGSTVLGWNAACDACVFLFVSTWWSPAIFYDEGRTSTNLRCRYVESVDGMFIQFSAVSPCSSQDQRDVPDWAGR